MPEEEGVEEPKVEELAEEEGAEGEGAVDNMGSKIILSTIKRKGKKLLLG